VRRSASTAHLKLRFLGLCGSTNSGTWWIDSTNSALNIGPGPRICAVVGGAGGTGVSECLAGLD